MSSQLLEIQPRELKFTFELKKQSSCSVQLTNNTYHTVAFKVKTTSPRKYCVRPNVGVIMPKSTYEFTVIMQAQKAPPPDMKCKDKFLIQSTVVSFGTTDILPNTFSKDAGKYIEEVKLRVVLVSPPVSPVHSPVLSPINGVFKQGPFSEFPVIKEPVFNKVEFVTALHTVSKDVESRMTKDQEFNAAKDVGLKQVPNEPVLNKVKSVTLLHTVSKDVESRMTKDQEFNAAKDVGLKQVTNETVLNKVESVTALHTVSKDVESRMTKDQEFNAAKDVGLKQVPNESVLNKVESVTPLHTVANDVESRVTKDQEFNAARDVRLKQVTNETVLNKVESVTALHTVANDVESRMTKDQEFNAAKHVESKPKKDVVDSQELKPESKPAIDAELMPDKDVPNGDELKPANDVELKPAKVEELKPESNVIYEEQPEPAKDAELPSVKNAEIIKVRAVEELKLVSDIEEIKLKLNALESKLNEAQATISNLTTERRQSIQERNVLQDELVVLRRRTNVKRVHEGFPLLYVVMVALISGVLGYLFNESIC